MFTCEYVNWDYYRILFCLAIIKKWKWKWNRDFGYSNHEFALALFGTHIGRKKN